MILRVKNNFQGGKTLSLWVVLLLLCRVKLFLVCFFLCFGRKRERERQKPDRKRDKKVVDVEEMPSIIIQTSVDLELMLDEDLECVTTNTL